MVDITPQRSCDRFFTIDDDDDFVRDALMRLILNESLSLKE
jgi:hypothetical protein